MALRRTPNTRDLGASGLEAFGGYVIEDFLQDWVGVKKVKNIDEMLSNSPAVGALRLSIEMPIRDINWFFTGPNGDEDDPALDILNDGLSNLSHSWNDHIIDALLFAFYGWSMFTITYEQDERGRWLWKKFKMLGQDTVQRWIIADDGGIEGVQQYQHLWKEPIPIERMLLYRFRKTKNNPEGESILRPAYIPYYYIKHMQEIEAIGIERNLAGLPMVTPPIGADMASGGTDEATALAILRNARNDEQAGILLPSPKGEGDHNKWHFDLLSAPGGTKSTDVSEVISRYEKRILMSALSQFLMLGMDNVGALATFEGGTDFHSLLLNSVSDIIGETFTKFAIPRLLELNGFDSDGYVLHHSPAGEMDNSSLADILQKVGGLLTWTEEDQADLRARLRLPEKSIDELRELREEQVASRETEAIIEEDELAAHVMYAADRAPDDDERTAHEGRFTRALNRFFREESKRAQEGIEDDDGLKS